MFGNGIADVGDAHRIDCMKRAHGSGQVPPILTERVEMRDLFGIDAAGA
jgi:hypothetical protein